MQQQQMFCQGGLLKSNMFGTPRWHGLTGRRGSRNDGAQAMATLTPSSEDCLKVRVGGGTASSSSPLLPLLRN
eukprot:5613839-Alexandrium_andersonii.AAC.1